RPPTTTISILSLHDALPIFPQRENFYRHSEVNSDSHLKASLVGNSVTVLIDQGKLLLGRWQGIYFCEFDGPRTREMHVKVIDSRSEEHTSELQSRRDLVCRL